MTARIEIPKEKLVELYLNQKFSTRKIASILKCEHTAIINRLKKYKIEIRQPKKEIIIPKEKLIELYKDKKLSTQKIARILKISSCSVYYKLKEAGIPTRKKKIFDIDKNKLEELYSEKGLSCSKIAKLYKFDKVTVFEKLKKYSIRTRNYLEANIKHAKKSFDGTEDTKAYMIGFRLGDLNVKAINNKATVIIKSCTTKEAQLNLIKEVYGNKGHIWTRKYGKTYSIMVFLDKSFNFLTKKEDDIEEWIFKSNNLFFAFLGGYTDAEGNFGLYDNRARFRLGTYEKNILLKIQERLTGLGIKTNFRLETPAGYGNQHKDFYRISINKKESLLQFISLIKPYIKHAKRHGDMARCEENILERNKKHVEELTK